MGGPFVWQGGQRRDGTRLFIDDFDEFDGFLAEAFCFGGGAWRRPIEFQPWSEIVFKNDTRYAFDEFVDGELPPFRNLEGDAVPGERARLESVVLK